MVAGIFTTRGVGTVPSTVTLVVQDASKIADNSMNSCVL